LTDNTVTLAAVSGAHGVTGEVRLKLFAENVDSLKRYKSFNDGALTVKSLRPTKDGAIARFTEINDRNAAEKLRSTLLTVPREALPELGEGEYYYSDLLGLPCISTDGSELGTCVAVENFGASDVLEIQMPSVDGKPGKKFMVPMTADAVLGVIMLFDTSIHGFRAWRKNFDDKVRCRKFHQGGLDIGRTEAFEKGDVWLEIIPC
jgi:16S rRNA processing protein RimM